LDAQNKYDVRFGAFTAVEIFWVVTPYSVVVSEALVASIFRVK
jgi:hypothetical protein